MTSLKDVIVVPTLKLGPLMMWTGITLDREPLVVQHKIEYCEDKKAFSVEQLQESTRDAQQLLYIQD